MRPLVNPMFELRLLTRHMQLLFCIVCEFACLYVIYLCLFVGPIVKCSICPYVVCHFERPSVLFCRFVACLLVYVSFFGLLSCPFVILWPVCQSFCPFRIISPVVCQSVYELSYIFVQMPVCHVLFFVLSFRL